jgi:23S rRNA (uracil1939-C5)-methyltransferase
MTQQIRLKHGDEVQLDVTSSAFEGGAIGRLHGFVVFVEGAIPGDRVTARILKSKRNHAEAKLLDLIIPSPDRVPPRCSHFGVCGGCKWQQVKYEAQLRFKQQHVVDSFQRIGGFEHPQVLPIIGADPIFFYRNKMEFSFSDQEWHLTPPPKPVIGPASEALDAETVVPSTDASQLSVFLGLHVPQRYDKILDVKACYLQSELSNRVLEFTRDFCRENKKEVYSSDLDTGYLRFLVIRQSKRNNEMMVNLVTRTDDSEFMTRYSKALMESVTGISTIVNTINSKKAQIAFGDQERLYAGDGTIRERLGDHAFVISAGSFFQTNTEQAERLFEAVKDFGEFKNSDVVYDLYSGTGSIAMFIASAVKQVIGVESVESAVRDAQRNTSANNIANCQFVLGDLKDRLTKDMGWMQDYPKPDAIILDPPRSGIHPKVIERLVEMGCPKIIYVSCNPATQARDVKALCAGERYFLEKLQPVDMFPHTYHIENVALLRLK